MTKKFLNIGIFIAIYIAFHTAIEKAITSNLVKPIAEELEASFTLDFIFFLAALFIVVYALRKIWINYFLAPNTVILNGLILGFVIYYRCFDKSVWEFTSLINYPNFKYVDLVILFSACNLIVFTAYWTKDILLNRFKIIWYVFSIGKRIILNKIVQFFNWLKTKFAIFVFLKKWFSNAKKVLRTKVLYSKTVKWINKNKKPKSGKRLIGFITDEPLTDQEDLLHRKDFAEEIVNKLKTTNALTGSFALGITGTWGSGKTSFLNMMQKVLKNDSSVITIQFNPWLSHSENAMIKEFFNALSENISTYNSEFSILISNYVDLLVESNDSVSSIIKTVRSFISQNLTETQFEKINQAMTRLDKKVFFFIDDVDRLDKAEVKEIIKLIRNSANFTNLFFVVAYDRNYVIDAIEEINKKGADLYLEKIFQKEFRLPGSMKDIIFIQISKLLKPMLSDSELSELQDLNDSQNIIINTYAFSSLRDIKRFYNSFIISYDYFKNELFFKDIFVIEQIKCKYPNIAELILNQTSDFFELKKYNQYHEYWSIIIEVSDELGVNNEIIAVEKLRKYLQTLLVSELEINELLKNIMYLFREPYTNDITSVFSFSNPKILKRYESSLIPSKHVFKNDFLMIFKVPNLSQYIKEIVESAKHIDFINKLMHFNEFRTREEFEVIIKSIFLLAEIIEHSENPKYNHFVYEYWDLRDKINVFSTRNDLYRYEFEFQEFIASVLFKSSCQVCFPVTFMYIVRQDEQFELPFDTEVLIDYSISFLKEHLSKVSSINYKTWRIFFSCNLLIQDEQSTKYKHIINSRAREVLIERIKADNNLLVSYLLWTIEPDNLQNFYKMSKFVKIVFAEFYLFEEFLNELPVSVELEEYKNFYFYRSELHSPLKREFNFMHLNIDKRKKDYKYDLLYNTDVYRVMNNN